MFMSEVAWVGCIEAISCSVRKRGMSCSEHDLRVLDAVAQRLRIGMGLIGRRIAVQHLAIGAVANRMDGNLVPLAEGLVDLGRHHGRRLNSSPRLPGVVGVWLQHRRAATAQRAIGEQLDGAGGEEIAAVADQRAVLADHVEVIAGVVDHRVDAGGELVRIGVLAIQPIGGKVDARHRRRR